MTFFVDFKIKDYLMKKKALLIISISCLALALIGVTYKKKLSSESINKKHWRGRPVDFSKPVNIPSVD